MNIFSRKRKLLEANHKIAELLAAKEYGLKQIIDQKDRQIKDLTCRLDLEGRQVAQRQRILCWENIRTQLEVEREGKTYHR
jgi:hypothetical protein